MAKKQNKINKQNPKSRKGVSPNFSTIVANFFEVLFNSKNSFLSSFSPPLHPPPLPSSSCRKIGPLRQLKSQEGNIWLREVVGMKGEKSWMTEISGMCTQMKEGVKYDKKD